jgi:VanZ family protein
MLMEVIQSTLPHRWFDMKDALANTLGVIIALVVLHFGGNTILQRFEKALSRSTGK